MPKRTEFGKYCQSLRNGKKMPLFDFAKRIKYSPSFICSLETGRKVAPKGYIENISSIFDLTDLEIARMKNRELRSRGSLKIDDINKREAEFLAAFIENRSSIDEQTLVNATEAILNSVQRGNCDHEKS